VSGALVAEAVTLSIGERTVLAGVALEAIPGELLALVGPNGAGKSTLLAVLSGELAPTGGRVVLDGRELHRMRHLDRSRRRAMLAQENVVSFPFRVREVIEMGRAPWARRATAEQDRAAVEAAVAATDVAHLLDRVYPSLSGGEKARVSLARVLAQDTPIVLLDEPTAALDLGHQEAVMRVARELARAGRAVVVVLHDLTLAGAYADRIALLDGGRLVAVGAPDDVLTAERLGAVYGTPVEVLRHGDAPLVVPVRRAAGAPEQAPVSRAG